MKKRHKLIVFYDEYCPLCTKVMKVWSKMDKKDLIDFRSFRREVQIQNESITLAEMQKAMYSRKENEDRYYQGYNTFIQMVFCIPILWWALPFLYFFKVLGIGNLVYRYVAQKRRIVPHNLCEENECKIEKRIEI
jgi:predicted DCC family thiol-disulfide oxidoreductase YuxK